MFPYLATKENFLKDSKYMEDLCESVNYMLRHLHGSGVKIEESEQKYTEASLESLKKVLSDKRISSSIMVGFEYFPDNGNSPYKRADILLSGMNKNDERIIILIEAKSWERLENFNFKSKTKNPSLQVQEYVKLIEDANTIVKQKKIHIVPVVWLFNCDEKPTSEQDALWKDKGKVNVFYKNGNHDGTQTLTDFIAETLNKPGSYANDVFSEFKKGQPAASLRLYKGAKNIVSGSQMLHLTADQKACYESIIDSINNKSEIKSIEVAGGPGSGKSILALKILSYCKKEKKSAVCYYPIYGPAKIYGGGIEEVQEVRKLLQEKSGEYEVIIVDEAQECFENIPEYLKKYLKDGGTCIFFYDIKQISNDKKHYPFKEPDHQLASQFRCNQDDGYLTFIYDILDNTNCFKHKADWIDFDVKIIKDQHDLRTISELNEYVFLTGDYYEKARKTLPGTALNFYWDKNDDYRFVEKHEGTFGGVKNIKGLEAEKVVVYISKEDIAYKKGKIEAKSEEIKNGYRVLLTRGLKSCYIYIEDKKLKEFLHKDKGIEYLSLEDVIND